MESLSLVPERKSPGEIIAQYNQLQSWFTPSILLTFPRHGYTRRSAFICTSISGAALPAAVRMLCVYLGAVEWSQDFELHRLNFHYWFSLILCWFDANIVSGTQTEFEMTEVFQEIGTESKEQFCSNVSKAGLKINCIRLYTLSAVAAEDINVLNEWRQFLGGNEPRWLLTGR